MGACYLRLRQPQKAQPILQTYLASASYTSLHKQSITLVDLAKTYALQGNLEEMYKYADQAMYMLEQTRSTRVLQRMFNLRQELNKWQDTIYVKQLDQHLTAITPSSA